MTKVPKGTSDDTKVMTARTNVSRPSNKTISSARQNAMNKMPWAMPTGRTGSGMPARYFRGHRDPHQQQVGDAFDKGHQAETSHRRSEQRSHVGLVRHRGGTGQTLQRASTLVTRAPVGPAIFLRGDAW
jgi:hypothetical protein